MEFFLLFGGLWVLSGVAKSFMGIDDGDSPETQDPYNGDYMNRIQAEKPWLYSAYKYDDNQRYDAKK